jgi:hypothetical protein
MRQIFVVMIALMMLLVPMAALAEEAVMPAAAWDWEGLGTIAGATAATLMIVQLIKAPLDKVWKIPTRLVVYAVALVILMAATLFTGKMSLENAGLAILNAVMVALGAYGSYELMFKKQEAG